MSVLRLEYPPLPTNQPDSVQRLANALHLTAADLELIADLLRNTAADRALRLPPNRPLELRLSQLAETFDDFATETLRTAERLSAITYPPTQPAV
jgi:hypothetical protein